MKHSKYIFATIAIIMVIFLNSCSKDYGNLNNPTVEQFLSNASRSELNNLVSGTESGLRNNLAIYLDDIGIIGREGYRFSGSEPRYTTDLLGANEATLNGSNFYITNPWTSRYRVIKNCNLLIEAANNSTLISDIEKRGYIGFATTIKAYQLLLNINLTDSNGIRINVSDPENLGPIVSYDEGLSSVAVLLDSAKVVLKTAVVAFPLAGFEGFSDAPGLIQVNRAIAARVAAYRKKWPEVLTDLNESFFGLTNDFYLGVYNVFGTGSGDQLNPVTLRFAEVSFRGSRFPLASFCTGMTKSRVCLIFSSIQRKSFRALSFFSSSSVFASAIEKAIQLPSGDHSKSLTPDLISVNASASPPAARST